MSAASIVTNRTHHASMDKTPMPPYEPGVTVNTTVTAAQVEAARHIVQANALSAADRIRLTQILGLDEGGEECDPGMGAVRRDCEASLWRDSIDEVTGA